MATAKIYCPWCGREMELDHYGVGEHAVFLYECPDCAAQSPLSYSEGSAHATALARPLQKPLTLEEACESEAPCVFIEHIRIDSISAADVEISPERIDDKIVAEIQVIGSSAIGYAPLDEYGTRWRCWATNPTEEERSAAKWEE